jgi:putative transposase
MPRVRRHRRNFNLPGHAHELTFSCYHNYAFLRAERTCQWLADAIASARHRHDFAVWAYVFMPDHAHIIIHPCGLQYDVARIRQAIKGPVGNRGIDWIAKYAPDWLPRVTRRRAGCYERLFWQSGGGYDRNIDSGQALLKMIDYIHLNPVRKGLVDMPSDWRWSSAAYYLTGVEPPIPIDPIPAEWTAHA